MRLGNVVVVAGARVLPRTVSCDEGRVVSVPSAATATPEDVKEVMANVMAAMRVEGFIVR
jgi:hypothetical protein